MTKRRRRVIALSDADRRRLQTGELSRPEDALAEREPTAGVRGAVPGPPGAAPGPAGAVPRQRPRRDPDDDRILKDVPPHFGPL